MVAFAWFVSMRQEGLSVRIRVLEGWCSYWPCSVTLLRLGSCAGDRLRWGRVLGTGCVNRDPSPSPSSSS